MTPDGRVADSGEVVEIDPPRKLVLTWQHHLTPEVTPEGHSRLSFRSWYARSSGWSTLGHRVQSRTRK